MEFKKQLIQDILDGYMDDEALSEFVGSRDPEIAIAAATVASPTEKLLVQSAKHANKDVRLAVLKNPKVTKEIVQVLTEDADADVALAAKELLPTLGEESYYGFFKLQTGSSGSLQFLVLRGLYEADIVEC